MTEEWEQKEQVRAYYNRAGDAFDAAYQWEGSIYPSNRVRAELSLDVLAARRVRTVLDAGCGTGLILVELLRRGFDAYGFDFSETAVEQAKARLSAAGFDPSRARRGDIERTPIELDSGFDAAIVMGAFTHPLNHAQALQSLRTVMRAGGLLIVELRNELFNLVTANEYTLDYLRQLLPDSGLKDQALAALKERFTTRTPVPPSSRTHEAWEEFFTVPSVWRNPLIVAAEYAQARFRQVDNLFFHWHAVPPAFEALDRAEFRRASLELEWHPHDWRGLFLCSAFLLVAEAV